MLDQLQLNKVNTRTQQDSVRRIPTIAPVKLHQHQATAVRQIMADFRQGHTRQLVVLPTGGGKTVLACHVVKRMGGRALFIVHTDELVRQTVKTMQQFVRASAIGIVKGSQNESHRRIVVASVQSLRKPERLHNLARDFRTIIWDECHHAQAKSYLSIRRYLDGTPALHLGLTATPWRLDGNPLEELFPHKSVHLTIRDGILDGWLAPVVGKLIYLREADFSKLRVRHGDFKPVELEWVMRAANWDEYVARAYFEHAGKRKTIVFVPTVAMAHQLAQRINTQGGKAEAVDGRMDMRKRRDIVARLAAGKLDVVVNCAVLTEGFDDPLIECVIMARPTASWALYVQCVGRGLRRVQDKTCLVLDVVGASRRHSLVNFPQFVEREQVPGGGKPKGEQDEQAIEPLTAEMEALWVDLLHEPEENPPCVDCKGKTHRLATYPNGHTAYRCTGCRKAFTLHPDGHLSAVASARRVPNPACIRCKGKTKKGKSNANGGKTYRCMECQREFTLDAQGNLSRQGLAMGKPNPPCVFCKGQTKKASTHANGNKAYTCRECSKTFSLSSDGQLSKQSFLALNEPNPPCIFCQGRTVKGQRKANGSRRYDCKRCRKGFTLTSDGERTRQSITQTSLKPPCPLCNGKTVRRSVHSNGNQAYACKECRTGFTLMPDGRISSRTLSRLQPNPPCVHCQGKTGKARTRANGSRAYRCSKCRKEFTFMSDWEAK